MPPIEILLNYFFGSTTLVAIYIAWKSRNSEIKQKEATALESIDSIYQKMTNATDKKFEEMQKIIDSQNEEIKQLKELVQNYSAKCATCSNKNK